MVNPCEAESILSCFKELAPAFLCICSPFQKTGGQCGSPFWGVLTPSEFPLFLQLGPTL